MRVSSKEWTDYFAMAQHSDQAVRGLPTGDASSKSLCKAVVAAANLRSDPTLDQRTPSAYEVPVTSFPQQPSCHPTANHKDLQFMGMSREPVIILVDITEQLIIHDKSMTIG